MECTEKYTFLNLIHYVENNRILFFAVCEDIIFIFHSLKIYLEIPNLQKHLKTVNVSKCFNFIRHHIPVYNFFHHSIDKHLKASKYINTHFMLLHPMT